MAAHDRTGKHPAYSKSDPPEEGGKSHNFNLDRSGISMSLRTFAAVATIGGTIFLSLVGYAASLSTVEDLAEHNVNAEAHAIMIDPDGAEGPEPAKEKHLVEVVVANHKAIRKIDEKATRAEVAAINVQNGFYDQRAEAFASQAVSKLPKKMPTSRKLQKYEEYKSQARKNLEKDKAVHHQMEDLAF